MRKAAVFLFSAATLLLVALYSTACLTPYLNPANWWPGTYLSLVYPLLALAMIVTIITWCFIRKRIALVLMVLLAVGYKNLAAVFGVRPSAPFTQKKGTATLRVLDWNTRQFSSNLRSDEGPENKRRRMMDYMRKVNADVLLMQEFMEMKNESHYSNVKTLRDSLGYRYYHISRDQTNTQNNTEYGNAIFSKVPLMNIVRREYEGEGSPESLLMADVFFGGRRVRLATTHLISLSLGGPPNNAEYFGRKDSYFVLHSSQLQRLKRYDSIHGRQADFVRNILDSSAYPVIISGDFNSVPSSYTYHTIKGNRQDAFLQKGIGFGNTYVGLSPTLRIDYILLSRQFKVKQFTSPRLVLSDHYPLVADISWK